MNSRAESAQDGLLARLVVDHLPRALDRLHLARRREEEAVDEPRDQKNDERDDLEDGEDDDDRHRGNTFRGLLRDAEPLRL